MATELSTTQVFLKPRLVFVTRKTPLELLIERHGTHGQARFYLQSRGQSPLAYELAHERALEGLKAAMSALPPDRRRARVDRDELDRFIFAPDDIIVIVGQDGLVPNVAKYLSGQWTIGINPDPASYDGVLCQHPPSAMGELLSWLDQPKAGARSFRLQKRVMAMIQREDEQRLQSLNEIFVGHRTHQSARYRLKVDGAEERQSSSGLICATGTGSTGWARSIAQQRKIEKELPGPEEQLLAWFVREPFPSVSTGTSLDFGFLGLDQELEIVSEMGEDGVIFADGIESDRIEFVSGQSARIRIAEHTLNLVARP